MKNNLRQLVTLVFGLVLVSCASSGSAASQAKIPEFYDGYGESPSYLGAINKAKMDAVKKAVVDLIGQTAVDFNKEKLNANIFGSASPDYFVFPETLKPIARLKKGDNETISINIKVNLQYIKDQMTALSINYSDSGASGGVASRPGSGSSGTGSTGTAVSPDKQRAMNLVNGEMGGTTPGATGNAGTTGTAGTGTSTDADWGKATEDEARQIRKYLDTMTYMVYFNDETKDPTMSKDFMRIAVSQANQYLVSNSFQAIDMTQIEKLKDDQRKVFEEESKGDVGFIQWIAQKLNAGVYIEINATTSSEKAGGGKYFGQVTLDIKMFDPSTAQLLGSVPFKSNKAFSTSSEKDAITNAIQNSVFTVMPVAIEQSKNFMAKALTRGIKYDLVIQKTADSKLMSQFRRKLQARVKQLTVVTSSPEESKYEVYFVGSLSDLEDSIYTICDTIPGLEGMYQVMLRGKSLTLNTGL